MENFLLIAHLTGAVGVGMLIAGGLAALYFGKKERYRPLASSIGALGGLQLVSGSALTLAMSGALATFCVRIGIYLAVIIAMEIALLYAMKREELSFPSVQALSPLGFGMAVSLACMIALV